MEVGNERDVSSTIYFVHNDRFKSANPRIEEDWNDIGIHMWFTRQWNSQMDV
jgi:hypothetical protein